MATGTERAALADRVRQGLVSPEPGTPAPAADDLLVQQYAAMAHEFAPQPVDHVLRVLDLVIASVAGIVSLPLSLLIALALKLSSPRHPVLYRGWRVGRAGHMFQMLKFRTLAPDAEVRLGPYLGPQLTQLTQHEVSRLGRVLRASKLDELPQLYNVVRGDMSLVGPRPIRPAFFAELCVDIPQYWQRLVVRPGLTGLAQLRLTREMTWSEKLAHDLEYTADRSLGLYLSVLATTAWLLVMRPANRRSASLNHLP